MPDLGYKKQKFAFLAHPPPIKRRPSPQADAALPPTPPSKFASILTWIAAVQPGSPAPRSPDSACSRRRSSTSSTDRSRRPFITSFFSAGHSAAPVAEKFDLTVHGYTSFFVPLPKTPTTPSPLLREYDLKHRRVPEQALALDIPAPKRKSTMRRFRSLSILRPREAKKNVPLSPTSPYPSSKKAKAKIGAVASPRTASTPGSASKAEICAATIAKRKRAKYAYVRPPPTLAQELAVMQFADGGNMEKHIQRVMEAQARMAAGSRATAGVAGVYRDENGGVWWDEDEEMEYVHLLGGEEKNVDMGCDWEMFNDPGAQYGAMRTAPMHTHHYHPYAVVDERRSSLSSVDSDLDPQYLLPLPENEDPRSAMADDRALASHRIGGPGMSILSLPSRPRRTALHLAKPSHFLIGDAFIAPTSPSSNTAGSPVHGGKENANTFAAQPRGKARRRPAPLKLASSNTATRRRGLEHHRSSPCTPPARALPPVPVASLISVSTTDEGPRKAFIADSFAPPVPQGQTQVTASTLALAPPTMTPSRMAFKGVKGLFGLGRKASTAAVVVN